MFQRMGSRIGCGGFHDRLEKIVNEYSVKNFWPIAVSNVSLLKSNDHKADALPSELPAPAAHLCCLS